MTPQGKIILGDRAFVTKSRVTYGEILRGWTCTETTGVPMSELLAAVDEVLQRVMSSERQSTEWEIRAVQAPFRHLRVPLPADSSQRCRILQVVVHLFNFYERVIELNQIRAVCGNPDESQKPYQRRYAEENTN